MSLILRDSITASDIPLGGLAAAAGYGDGPWTWSSADWARFDQAGIPVLSIVINAANQGDVLDVETSDATPEECPGWRARFKRPARRAPTFYCNRITWPKIVNALGINAARQCDWWISTLDGTLDVYYGQRGVAPPSGLRVVAVQWKGSAQTGGHYDESIILDSEWIGSDMSLTDDQVRLLVQAAQVVTATDAGRDPNGTPADLHWLTGYAWLEVQKHTAMLGELLGDESATKQAIDALSGQVQASATMLADIKTALADAATGNVDEAKLAAALGDDVAAVLARKLAA